MASLLRKKLSTFLLLPIPHLRLTLLPLLRLSTEAHQQKNPPFLAQYLISSFGFSPDKALRVASYPYLSPINSPARPEALVLFLKETGLTDSQIKKAISFQPQLMRYSVADTLEPRARELIDSGFTGETLIQLILLTPGVLLSRYALSRLQFWRNCTGNDDALLKTLKRNRRLLQLDIDKVVMPNIKLLRDYGFTDAEMRKVFLSVGYCLIKPDSFQKLLEETEALGFARESRNFLNALVVVGRHRRDSIVKKLEFLRKMYGLSEEELQTFFKRFPTIINLSEKNMESKRDFFLCKVGLTKKDVISQPSLLGLSLQGRLMPRYYVLNVLKLKGLNTYLNFRVAFTVTEKDFLEKFVVPYEKEIPELKEVYSAALLRKMTI